MRQTREALIMSGEINACVVELIVAARRFDRQGAKTPRSAKADKLYIQSMNTEPNPDKSKSMPDGPGSSGEENADMDRDMTGDLETEKSAEAPGNDPAKKAKAEEGR